MDKINERLLYLQKSVQKRDESEQIHKENEELYERKELDLRLYEKVLYKLGKDLELDTEGSYQDMYILALEKLMNKSKVDELEVYDFREIAHDIEEQKGNRIIKAVNVLIRSLK